MVSDLPDKEDMVRAALVKLGEAPPADLSAFIQREYGVSIQPRHIPIYKAILRGREQLEQAREAARRAIARQAAESPVKSA
jgi:hypothetical protein